MNWLKALSLVLMFPIMVQAQDGQKLFNSNCAACHKIDDKLIGPPLKGVKEKWEKAGEADLLYEWIKNPKALYDKGESQMAKDIWDYDASMMAPQAVSNEEIDAIFDYVAAGPAEVVKDTSDTNLDIAQGPVTDYEANANIFWALLALGFFLMIGIIVMTSSIRGLVGSEYYQKKLKNKLNDGGKAALVLAFLGISTTAFGQGEGQQEIWFKFEMYHLWIMLTVDLILFGALLYVRSVFKSLVKEAQTEEVRKKEEKLEKERSLNKILTAAVDIEDEESVLMDHDYDGIQELDNDLPPWWVWGFYASIVFAVIYLLYYHVFQTGDLQYEAYVKDMKQAEEDVAEYLAANAMNVDENTVVLLEDASALSAGQETFKQYCVACHGENGEGQIGPNLTDNHWMYGNDVKDLFKVVKYGAKNGMKSWKEELNPQQMQQVVSYILSLEYKDGKEPEGDFYGEDGEQEEAFPIEEQVTATDSSQLDTTLVELKRIKIK